MARYDNSGLVAPRLFNVFGDGLVRYVYQCLWSR